MKPGPALGGRRIVRASLLLLAFAGALGAQVRPPADTLNRPAPVRPAGRPATGPAGAAAARPDSAALARAAADSVRADSIAKDTVRAPLAVAPRPALPEIRGRRTVWDREALFASGALTLAELLAQVPGATLFNAGFVAAPTAVSWYGQPGRVRVFLDGVELDPLDPREGGVRDLAVIQTWSLEEVAVERAAAELRVYLRSWRVRMTVAETRTDIVTGSENINLYRGFYGKRTRAGGAVQLAAQQYSTTSVRTAGDGDALAGFMRLGFAGGRLTVDASATRLGRNRANTYRYVVGGTGVVDQDAIGAFEGNDATGYLRAAWGDADSSGFWAQAIAASLRHEETGDSTAGADTARSQTQYVASAGVTRWGARLSATARLRVMQGETRLAPAVRASWDRSWFSVSAALEEGGPDSLRRLDALASLRPFAWLHVLAAHSAHAATAAGATGVPEQVSRVEVAGRAYGRWLSVGAVQRSAGILRGMPVFDSLFVDQPGAAATGLEVGLSGPVWRSFSADWRGIRWEAGIPYTPQVESHAELRVTPDFSTRFPRGTFGLIAGLTHDYRGTMVVPTASGDQVAAGAGWWGGYLEMRLGTARIFWYNRNASGKVHETVPGYLMPRLVQMYGVRWEFWN